MFTNNFALYSIKILAEIGRDIFYFPLWWYSGGLIQFIGKLIVFLRNKEKSLALSVWIKNIFKPMYAQRDWQGILISIFIRVAQIILRSIVMLVCVILALVFLCGWLVLPVFLLYQIMFQIA